jgi:hypothetical protein
MLDELAHRHCAVPICVNHAEDRGSVIPRDAEAKVGQRIRKLVHINGARSICVIHVKRPLRCVSLLCYWRPWPHLLRYRLHLHRLRLNYAPLRLGQPGRCR